MPRIIRDTLFEKLRALPALRTFVEDFRLATGLVLTLRNNLGVADEHTIPDSPLCRYLANCEAGQRLCQRTQQALFAETIEEPASCQCDAGLHEVAVPLRGGGNTLGYLVFCGMRAAEKPETDRRRIQHLLAKAGLTVSSSELDAMVAATRQFPQEVMAAYTRIVSMAAKQFVRQVTDHIMQQDVKLPALAHKARRYLRSHGLDAECNLQSVASYCGVSPSHLSRAFHAATGLTISEYIARFRIEHSYKLLKTTERPITDISFECGFQSISQFNRTFKKLSGKTPSAIRKAAR